MVTILTDLAQLMEQAYVESIRAAMINGNYSILFIFCIIIFKLIICSKIFVH